MRKFFEGFLFAWQGLEYAFKTQINMKFHFVMAALVVVAGWLLKVNLIEWTILMLCMALVIGMELMNTAVEKLTDLVTQQMHPLAKIAKDCAAAAVFVCAIAAAAIGVFIFLPKVLALL